jgi:hypothetical protein
MRYFTYLAEQAFKTSASGERLFYRGGPWSRPYIIPDVATEQRLYRKHVWMLRVLLGGLIVGQPFLDRLRPEVFDEPYWFLIYLIIVTAVFWVAGKAVFSRDLNGLQRAPTRLRLRSFYGQMAQRHSETGLALGSIGSLLLVAGGVWMLSIGANYAVGILSIVFGGWCAVGWGYALHLKLTSNEPPEEADEQRRD